MSPVAGQADLARAMEPVARELLGEPTEVNRAKNELRFGTRGSKSVNLRDGTFYDHELSKGGGVLELVQVCKQVDKPSAIAWLQKRGYIAPSAAGGQQREVAAYDYEGPDGEMLFQVARFDPKDFRQRRPDGNGGWIDPQIMLRADISDGLVAAERG
jgi:hypothetical protein